MEQIKTIKTDIHFIMFKIIGGKRVHTFDLISISDVHAITVAKDLHNKLGLIGRYYCETSSGFTFQIC